MHDVVGLRRMQTFQVLQQILLRQRGRPWSCSKAGTIIGPKYSSPSLLGNSLPLRLYTTLCEQITKTSHTALKCSECTALVLILDKKKWSRLPVLYSLRSGSAVLASKREHSGLSPIRSSLKALRRSQGSQATLDSCWPTTSGVSA